MNCNGKISNFRDDVKFDLIVFGSTQKGKIDVRSKYNKKHSQWIIKELSLITRDNAIKIV